MERKGTVYRRCPNPTVTRSVVPLRYRERRPKLRHRLGSLAVVLGGLVLIAVGLGFSFAAGMRMFW